MTLVRVGNYVIDARKIAALLVDPDYREVERTPLGQTEVGSPPWLYVLGVPQAIKLSVDEYRSLRNYLAETFGGVAELPPPGPSDAGGP